MAGKKSSSKKSPGLSVLENRHEEEKRNNIPFGGDGDFCFEVEEKSRVIRNSQTDEGK